MRCSQVQRSLLLETHSALQRSPLSFPLSVLSCSGSRVSSVIARGPWVATKGRYSSPGLHRSCTAGRRSLVCNAINLPEAVDATIRNIISISAVVGISYAILLAAVSEPPSPSSTARALPPAASAKGMSRGLRTSGGDRSEDDNFVWGLMGFISFLPLFDWLAWVLAALSDEDRATLYGIYAALYGSPLLLRGLNWQDPWVLFMLVLCVVHVQAERIAQTEPEVLRSIRPVGAVGAALRGLLGGAGSLLSGLGGVLAEDSRRAVKRPGGRSSSGGGGGGGSGAPAQQLGPGQERLQLEQDPDLVQQGAVGRDLDPRRDSSRDPELEDFATQELRKFDEQLRRAEQMRRGGRGGSGSGEGSSSGGAGN
ncbi:hypothetical protein PLESTB_001599700 [Pleodorina starrii]|uniref:Uncharacterized protein n=1 Tax=Pleodorina starrii TaxID=330485 RepID=A0A9W6BYS7_9CHLO|nr:hypothetical protein PLESTM_001043700 [Pleodorina starrii]GLC60335.1 hypothetical protein PLESTB_001599700 [Pleodorina starrii]GLC77530.1 hypothetical protein PLESTF_001951300 [Pleodorina starrii]